jgi:Cdc6-like AAA superfamily ATPase
LDDAAKYSSNRDIRFVVYAPSLIGRLANIGSKFGSSATVLTTNQFLRLTIAEELQAYIEKLSDQAPSIHVDPRVEVPAGFARKIPNPLLSLMTDNAPSIEKGALAILLAEPGQGKTHLCRYLVAELAKTGITRQFVPLMVDSSQWDRMALDDQRSIWKTIVNSFRHFDSPIPWLEGHEDEFLRVALKAGLFRIIFDGLDEYLLRNRESVQPMDVLDSSRREHHSGRPDFQNLRQKRFPNPKTYSFTDYYRSTVPRQKTTSLSV